MGKAARAGKRKNPAKYGPEDKDPRSGRFVPGNRGGPGRVPFPVDLANLQAVADVVGPDEWRDIARRMLREALGKDYTRAWRAREWLEAHTLAGATLRELGKLRGERPAPPAPLEGSPPPRTIGTLSSRVLLIYLEGMEEKLAAGRQLTGEEVEQAIAIQRAQVEEKVADAAEDVFSGLEGVPSRRIEDILLALEKQNGTAPAPPPAPTETP